MSIFDRFKNNVKTDKEEPSVKEASFTNEGSEQTASLAKSTTLGKELKIKREEALDELMENDGELAVDVYQTDSDIVVQSTIAGVKPDDLDISVENDVLTVRGKRENEVKKETKNYFYQECYWGAFSRQIILPEEVDPNRIDAEMENGILTIRLPKIQRAKLRKISVKKGEKKGD